MKSDGSQSALPSFARKTADGFELRVKVIPGVGQTKIVGEYGDRLKIRVAAPPEKGKANKELISFLKKLLGVRDIKVTAGETSRDKTIALRGTLTWSLLTEE